MQPSTTILPATRTTPHDPETAYALLQEIKNQTTADVPNRFATVIEQTKETAEGAINLRKLFTLWNIPASRNVGGAIAIGLPLGEQIQMDVDQTRTSLRWRDAKVRRTKNPALDILRLIEAGHREGDRYLDPDPTAPWTACRVNEAGNYQSAFGAAQLLNTPWLKFEPDIPARTVYEVVRAVYLGDVGAASVLTVSDSVLIVENLRSATYTFRTGQLSTGS